MSIRPGPRVGPVRGPATRPRPSSQAFLDRRAVRAETAAPARGAADRGARRRSPIDDPAGRCRRRPASARCSTSSRARQTPLAERIVTTSPDVTVSTNLGAWVNRRGLFAREKHGRHVQERAHPLDLQLGVLAQGPAHRARHRRDEPVHRCCRRSACRTRSTASGCCRSARSTIRSSRAASMRSTTPATRMRASSWSATPSGITLAPEGGAHQSIGTPLIGMAQDGLAAFEPAFVDELAVDPGVGVRLHPEGRRRRGLRAQLAARRDRRLGLSAALDAAGRADQARDDARAAPGASSTAPTGCASPARTARWSSPTPARSRPRRSRRSA